MRRSAILAAAILLPFTVAGAQTPNPIDCAKASTTVEMNTCADLDYAEADRELNAVYRTLVAQNKGNGRSPDGPYSAAAWEEALRASQRAWIAFRDADCKGLVPVEWSGGTGTTVAVLTCMTERTRTRIDELRARVHR